MKLGFVSAILPEYTLEQVLRFAHEAGFSSVELMCWPPGKSERRYAGVTHVDATNLSAGAIDKIQGLLTTYRVSISGLGYYPNPLVADQAESQVYVTHLRAVIDAAAALGVGVVNTFVGREPALSVEANWPRFLEVWRPLIAHAEAKGIKIGIENCPMLFTKDEWPGGKNLATTPAIWRGKRGVPPVSGVERGFAHEPVHTRLGAQPAVGMVAAHADGRALDACDLAGALIDDLGLDAVPVGPLQIHAQEHGRPVLRLRAAGTGLYVEKGAVRVHLAGEHPLELEPLHAGGELDRIALDLGGGAGIGLVGRHLQELARVAQTAAQAIEIVDDFLELRALLTELLRPLRILPNIRLLELAGDFLQALVLIVVIKDTSSRTACAPRDL